MKRLSFVILTIVIPALLFCGADISKKVSIDLAGADVSDALKAAASAAGFSILLDEAVRGRTVTVKLVDLPFSEVLDQVCEASGLAYGVTGDTILVDTLKNATEQGKYLRAEKVALRFIRANDAMEVLKKAAWRVTGVQVNGETNELMITDISWRAGKTVKMLQAIDLAPKMFDLQVEAAEVVSSEWSALSKLSGTEDTILKISDLEKKGKARLIMDRSLSAAAGKKVSVETSFRINYQFRAGTYSTENTGVRVELTPVPGENGSTSLELKERVCSMQDFCGPERNYPRTAVFESVSCQAVKAGETLVQSGINRTVPGNTREKFDYLGDIPLTGRFFSADGTKSESSEIVIILKAKPAQ